MTTPREDLKLIDRHLQSLPLTPEDRRMALGWVKLGQRLAALVTQSSPAPRRAVRCIPSR